MNQFMVHQGMTSHVLKMLDFYIISSIKTHWQRATDQAGRMVNYDQSKYNDTRSESMICRFANGPLEKFESVPELSKYGHAMTKIAASASEFLNF